MILNLREKLKLQNLVYLDKKFKDKKLKVILSVKKVDFEVITNKIC